MDRQEVWVKAWNSMASCYNGKASDCTRYADECLKEFDKRFPTRKSYRSLWRGKPISELSIDEFQEMVEYHG